MSILSEDKVMELEINIMKNYRKYGNTCRSSLQFRMSPESLNNRGRKFKKLESYENGSAVCKDMRAMQYISLKGKFIIVSFSV